MCQCIHIRIMLSDVPGIISCEGLYVYYMILLSWLVKAIYNHEPVHIFPIVETSRSHGRMPAALWIIAVLTPLCCCYSEWHLTEMALVWSHSDTGAEKCFFERVQSDIGAQPATCSVGIEGFFFWLEAAATGLWSCLLISITLMAWCLISNSASAYFSF